MVGFTCRATRQVQEEECAGGMGRKEEGAGVRLAQRSEL